MDNQFLNYNASLKATGEDTYQESFKIDESKGKKTRDKEFHEALCKALGGLLYGVKQGNTIHVGPLEQENFKGLKDNQFNKDLVFEYSTESLKTFPYRFGVMTYKVNKTRFYKLGLKVITASI